MPSYRAVLFDLDGTLIDSVRLILDSYHHTLEVHGIAPHGDDHWLQGLGTPLWAQLSAWATSPEHLADLLATYREYNHRNHDARVAAYPGVCEMIARVRASGIRTALVTSKLRGGALRGLEVCGLAGTMEVMVCADDVEEHKPHPAPVLRALEALGEPPNGSALFVGDSVHDMRAGRAAGVATAAVLWGPFRREQLEEADPDHWLNLPSDLLPLLGILEP